ncbi:MAG TPA: hypothetical protein VFK72_05605, partial [Nevskia sp.]|nr:hypothetical protein [Nevskia sp.]
MTDDQKPQDENHIIATRREKLEKLRAAGQAFPNGYRRDTLADELHNRYGALAETAEVEAASGRH